MDASEKRLRGLWTAQGIATEKQDALIAEIAGTTVEFRDTPERAMVTRRPGKPPAVMTETAYKAAVTAGPLHEQYRPACLDDVAGQPAAVARIRFLLARGGLAGRAYWISGDSGTGKTTLARIIAAEVASDWSISELDAGTITLATIQDQEATLSLFGFGDKPGRAIIINEAHGLKPAVVRQLLVMLERLPKHAVVIFTTTAQGEQMLLEGIDAGPLLSRCVVLRLLADAGTVAEFAKRAVSVAKRAGFGAVPLRAVAELVERCRCNLRAVLTEIESGALA